MTAKQKRWLYAVLIVLTIPLGLATRWEQHYFPYLIAKYGGDVFAATCIFFGCRFLCVNLAIWKVAGLGYGISVLIEIQQLYRAPWAVEFREMKVVGILLGHGFLWSDIACYAVGTIFGWITGVALEYSFAKRINPAAC